MDDCEVEGKKHHLKITGADDFWLVGKVFFACRNCKLELSVDRFYFYLSMKLPVRR